MSQTPLFNSEEDVRTKLIVPWLLAHGFDVTCLSIEFSFYIRAGRSIQQVESSISSALVTTPQNNKSSPRTSSPRADILVRNSDGSNLFVVEVKAPNVDLDSRGRDQAISYARLLANGNIAPFVILTNGNTTQIFDTFSKARIDGETLKSRCHPMREFVLSEEDLALRAEALESLISLSSDNLLLFCKAQVSFRMQLLASENIDSDKKFIAPLFVARADAQKRISELLNTEKRRVVLLVGPPQVGKTNFMCNLVNERLKDGIPCLFFPAIGLKRGLLDEISEDFEWILRGETPNSYSQLLQKLGHILRRLNVTMTIFVDGWNEANIQLARAIDTECSRLSCDHIQIVVSLTHSAAGRLLSGVGGNPSFLAECADVPISAAKLIELKPETVDAHPKWSVVNLPKYSKHEMEQVYAVYSSSYNVIVPAQHTKVCEPYVIGNAMKLYKNCTLPDLLDEPSLLSDMINRKIGRAIGLDQYDVRICLRELAREMFQNGGPVSIDTISKIWSIPISEKLPSGFFEAAILSSEVDEFCRSSIDFYYGRERDYCIAYLSQSWAAKIGAGTDITEEFQQAVKTNAGTEALSWFLKQPSHQSLMWGATNEFPHYQDARVRRILLNSLCSCISEYEGDHDQLLKFASNYALSDEDGLVRIEAIRLVSLIADEPEELTTLFNKGAALAEYIEAIVGLGEEFPLHSDSLGQVVLDALQRMHWDSVDDDENFSMVTDILCKLSFHRSAVIRTHAKMCFGYISPYGYFDYLSNLIRTHELLSSGSKIEEYLPGINAAEDCLLENYYGSICPGALEGILEDHETRQAEYEQLCRLLNPIFTVFHKHCALEGLSGLLDTLRPTSHEGSSIGPRDAYTRPLPF